MALNELCSDLPWWEKSQSGIPRLTSSTSKSCLSTPPSGLKCQFRNNYNNVDPIRETEQNVNSWLVRWAKKYYISFRKQHTSKKRLSGKDQKAKEHVPSIAHAHLLFGRPYDRLILVANRCLNTCIYRPAVRYESTKQSYWTFLYFKLARSPARNLHLSFIIMKRNLVPSPLLGDAEENDSKWHSCVTWEVLNCTINPKRQSYAIMRILLSLCSQLKKKVASSISLHFPSATWRKYMRLPN